MTMSTAPPLLILTSCESRTGLQDITIFGVLSVLLLTYDRCNYHCIVTVGVDCCDLHVDFILALLTV